MSQETSPKEQLTVPTFEEIIKTELAKYGEIFESDISAKIQEMAGKFLPLKINGLDDEDGYKAVSEALRFVVSRRTAVEAKRKELKADSLKFGRAVDARASEITLLLEPIENHLRSQKNIVDEEKKRIQQEKEEAERRKLEERNNRLASLGCYLFGDNVVRIDRLNANVEQVLTHRLNIELFDDAEFEAFVSGIEQTVSVEKAELDRIEAEKQAEAERQRQQAEALRQQQEELERQKAEIERQKEEMHRAKIEMRKNQLLSLGLIVSKISGAFYFKKFDGSEKAIITGSEVELIPDEFWQQNLSEITNQVTELKVKDEAEKVAKEEEEQARIEAAKEQARLQAEKELAEKQQRERIQKEQEEKLKAEQEAERLASLSDKEKADRYLAELLMVDAPELKSKKYGSAVKTIREYLENVKF